MSDPRSALIKKIRLLAPDLTQIAICRGLHNRLGFAYQLAFVRLHNRFPSQKPLEIIEEIVEYVGLQINIAPSLIAQYGDRQKTVSAHQHQIQRYLKLHAFSETDTQTLRQFIFEQSCQLEQTHALMALVKGFLRQNNTLEPATSTLQRLIQQERQKARDFIFDKLNNALTTEDKRQLDQLLETEGGPYSPLYQLKQSPKRASAQAIIRIAQKLDTIKTTGILTIDLSWLNNNLQRWMSRYVRKATATRLRMLKDKRRYGFLVCFLQQHYRDTTDDLVRMYDKVITQMYNRTQTDLDAHHRKHRKALAASLRTFQVLADTILDESIEDGALRNTIFNQISKPALAMHNELATAWLHGKHKDVFTLLVETRYSYLRQFAPTLLEHLSIEKEDAQGDLLMEAIEHLKEMNRSGKRKLGEDVSLDFMPRNMQKLVCDDRGKLDKSAWECGLMTTIRDHIKSGNIAVKHSKGYGRLDDFFMPEEAWKEQRSTFFKRSGLPMEVADVPAYLTRILNEAYDAFLSTLPHNQYAQLDAYGWKISKDESTDFTKDQEKALKKIQQYLAKHLRIIKLPQLLIEVDKECHFSRFFMNASQQKNTTPDDVRTVMAALMAHGCNMGSYTMSHLIEGVPYHRIKKISDWLFTEETQRAALASLVNAISEPQITKHWGEGKTSSSDGQRFSWRQQVLKQAYSPVFNDFALEFYSFIAHNYAPYFITPIECTDRDAPYVLDGLLYNESDLQIEEHYTDTHGYTEINFAAFAMLGKKFSPRIRGMQKQRIYRIDKQKDYGDLATLVDNAKSTIHMDWITSQWDKMGHFYASLESGYVTASTALKRLNGYTRKNHFYRANKELGRIFKTIHILQYMSDKNQRMKTTKGLLKGEQLHQLARDLKYAKRGRIAARDWMEQKNSASCLTLIMACIIYWQAKEIHRVLLECPPKNEIDLSLLKHISPITWDNLILYGEYVIEKEWIVL
jgi:TnpA family transposase